MSQPEVPRCSLCKRERTLEGMDVYDYSPLQVVTGSPLGWYSGDDGEICPEDMTRLVYGQPVEAISLHGTKGDS